MGSLMRDVSQLICSRSSTDCRFHQPLVVLTFRLITHYVGATFYQKMERPPADPLAESRPPSSARATFASVLYLDTAVLALARLPTLAGSFATPLLDGLPHAGRVVANV
ncbi:unnamed protein product [Prorocentrum cordatum]|uniref:Uncharacterized protein n=1 Tax=Prorocentrum cordatum TaxID=2364126 RepID=A0ABN9QNX6_9DINO|nr:unnamed protein product [Polarella glacialis]